MFEGANWAWLKAFTDMWSVFFRREGTIIDNVVLHIIVGLGTTALAVWLVAEHGLNYDSTYHSFSGIGVGFLIVFRSSIAYSRFWEGTGHIGSMLADIKSLAMIASATLQVPPDSKIKAGPGPPGPTRVIGGEERVLSFDMLELQDIRSTLKRYLKLFFFVITAILQEKEDVWGGERVSGQLREGESKQLRACKGVSGLLIISMWIVGVAKRAHKRGYAPSCMIADTNKVVVSLIKGVGGATKIKSTNVPFPYCQLCAWLVTTYVYTIPFPFATKFSENGSAGWGLYARTMLASCMTSLAFFGILATSMELEDPFGEDANDLPLVQMGDGLSKELDLLLGPVALKKWSSGWDAGCTPSSAHRSSKSKPGRGNRSSLKSTEDASESEDASEDESEDEDDDDDYDIIDD